MSVVIGFIRIIFVGLVATVSTKTPSDIANINKIYRRLVELLNSRADNLVSKSGRGSFFSYKKCDQICDK